MLMKKKRIAFYQESLYLYCLNLLRVRHGHMEAFWEIGTQGK